MSLHIPNQPYNNVASKRIVRAASIPNERFQAEQLAQQIDFALKMLQYEYFTKTFSVVENFGDIRLGEFKGLIISGRGTTLDDTAENFSDEVLQKLEEIIRKRVKICAFTDSKEEDHIFEKHKIRTVKNAFPKPHAAGFKLAATQLDLRPAECVMAGSTIMKDGGARQAGMGFILVKPIAGSLNIGDKMANIFGRAVKNLHDRFREKDQKNGL